MKNNTVKNNLEEKTVEVKKIFKGKVLDVEIHTVSLPNGETSTRELINHRGAVAILAVTKDNEVILVEQYRKAIDSVTLEIPAGKLEDGEVDNKKKSAVRELQEETGYVVTEDRLEKICDVHVALGYSSELITIYYVDNLEYAGEQNPDEDEFINLKKYPIDEAIKLLDDNVITDSKTMLALLYLKTRKGKL
ncbi:hydrolase, NUDIX family [Gemella bergeri ATCC 700627]|uniref:Hydrolase, NUDIX family n=1 Tax=Gemella bergeri ATCC 700627 TaxID=1321820 RepID=U2QVN7_9BACL|nr:NUDIX hydrolase [Gemella bergeri]ERK60289.1 hydrolase, NUDIX family [Gemella bergeri ATCC 700627]